MSADIYELPASKKLEVLVILERSHISCFWTVPVQNSSHSSTRFLICLSIWWDIHICSLGIAFREHIHYVLQKPGLRQHSTLLWTPGCSAHFFFFFLKSFQGQELFKAPKDFCFKDIVQASGTASGIPPSHLLKYSQWLPWSEFKSQDIRHMEGGKHTTRIT